MPNKFKTLKLVSGKNNLMDFDIEANWHIFTDFLKGKPEITVENLKADLNRYYLPFADKLIKLKNSQDRLGLIVGVSAIQGTGKTTQGQIMNILLKHFGYEAVSLSIDDHYVTHAELNSLRSQDPRLIRRGVTHDIKLAIANLQALQNMTNTPVLIAGYDKSAHQGDGDRFRWINRQPGLEVQTQVIDNQLRLVSATFQGQMLTLPNNMGADIPLDEFSLEQNHLPNGWNLVTRKPDFIFYDGWMLGAKAVTDESVFEQHLDGLSTPEDIQFARDINKRLADYQPLWDLIDFMNVLYVPNYHVSIGWRDQAEDVLRQKGGGMNHLQIIDFVKYFWRSVHPEIHIKKLAQDPSTDQVVIIGDDHSIKEILTPQEVMLRYP